MNDCLVQGEPVPAEEGARYRIGALLGCTAPAGNTVKELVSMIDRSVAADATHPVRLLRCSAKCEIIGPLVMICISAVRCRFGRSLALLSNWRWIRRRNT